jgi:hypothetical protein
MSSPTGSRSRRRRSLITWGGSSPLDLSTSLRMRSPESPHFAMSSKLGSSSLSPPPPQDLSTAAIWRVLKRLPGSMNELLNPSDGFDPINLDTAAYVDPERPHLTNRGANIL